MRSQADTSIIKNLSKLDGSERVITIFPPNKTIGRFHVKLKVEWSRSVIVATFRNKQQMFFCVEQFQDMNVIVEKQVSV